MQQNHACSIKSVFSCPWRNIFYPKAALGADYPLFPFSLCRGQEKRVDFFAGLLFFFCTG
ncbi:hypothetical protein CNY67_03570 [Desulfovibrio sp. G11]|nr:hypothetical protein CNY67_03570 [Desulfovibrio sp. G11]